MTWDEGLARESEQWAMQLARENRLRHSRGSYGENLYAAWGQSASCAQAVLSWYDFQLKFDLKLNVQLDSIAYQCTYYMIKY